MDLCLQSDVSVFLIGLQHREGEESKKTSLRYGRNVVVKCIAAADLFDPRCEMPTGSGDKLLLLLIGFLIQKGRQGASGNRSRLHLGQAGRSSAWAPPHFEHMVLEAAVVHL